MRRPRSGLVALWDGICAAVIWAIIALLTVVFALAIILAAVLLAPIDRRRAVAHWLATAWGCAVFLCIPTWRIRVEGRSLIAPGRPWILVSNHQSMLDIMALFCVRKQFKWVAKASLFTVPFLGWAMAAARYIKLVRGQRESIRVTYGQAKRWLEQRMPVFFFPEGTRSVTGQLLPFKNGAFKLSLATGVPVVPIAIDGTRHLLTRGSWVIRHRADVRIRILPPVNPRKYPDDPDRFRDDVRAMIDRARHELAEASHRATASGRGAV